VNKNALFEITTRLEKDDYRRFSYATIFQKKYLTISLIILLAAVGSVFYIFMEDKLTVLNFFLYWVIMIAIVFAAIFVSVEYKNIKKINVIRSGYKKAPKQKITFFDDYLVAEDENANRSHKIKYDNLLKVLESKDFYIIFASKNIGSPIRKIDVDREYSDEFKRFLKEKFGERYKTTS